MAATSAGGNGVGAVTGRRLVQVGLASAVGSCLEWYDFFIYGNASAIVFAKLFFPTFDPVVGTLLSFATFGVGFFARPFGGLVFGHFGDRIGRRTVLVITLLLVGGGTFLIGVLPTYAAVGLAAPALLVFLRLVQGFGAGAEYSGAVIYAVEHAPPGRRGWFGSWSPMGVAAGQLIAAGVLALLAMLPQDAFLSWGWRVPFLVSLVLIGVGLWIRLRLMETPVFQAVRRQRAVLRTPIKEALVRHPKSFLVVLGARMAENGLGYLFPTWGLSYLTLQLGFSKAVALDAVTIATVAELVMVPVWSVLSDRVGRRAVYGGAAAFCVAFAFPFFLLLSTRSTPVVVFAMAVALGVGVAGMFGPQAAFFAELFGPRTRYSGFAFARELGSIISGGPAPTVASLLVLWFAGAPWGVACYIVLLAGITTAAVFWAPETHRVDIAAEDPEREAAAPAVRPAVS